MFFLNCESTEIDSSTIYQPKLTVILLGAKCPRGPTCRVHQQRNMHSGKNKLYNGLDDRFWKVEISPVLNGIANNLNCKIQIENTFP